MTANTYENHGKLWTNEHYATLFRLFCENVSVSGIARELGRQTDAVMAKLARVRLADELTGKVCERDHPRAGSLRDYYALVVSGAIPKDLNYPPTQAYVKQALERARSGAPSESSLKTVADGCLSSTQVAPAHTNTDKDTDTMQFTIQHLLNGRDIATMSDDEIFRVIAQTEAEIDKLDQIKSKPARLVKLIAQKRGDLEKLIAFLNAQDDAQQAA